MAAVEVSCLPAASCETPTHSWDIGSTVGDGNGDGDWDGNMDWDGDGVVLVVAVYTKDLREIDRLESGCNFILADGIEENSCVKWQSTFHCTLFTYGK